MCPRALFALLACLALSGAGRAQPVGAGGAAGAGPAPAPGANAPAQLATKSEAVPAFSAISTCMPINVMVAPNTTAGGGHTVTVQAEQPVLGAIRYRVDNNTLFLETSGNFSTNRPIKVTVSLPPNGLQRLDHFGTGAMVFVSPGFNLDQFRASSAFAGGDFYILDMTANSVVLTMSGVGDTVLIGNFGAINLAASGTGTAYIVGGNGTIDVNLSGVVRASIRPGSPTANITGRAGLTNSVQYTSGTCSVKTDSPFANTPFPLFAISPCTSVPFISVPPPEPVWSCGLRVEGNFTCGPGGEALILSSNGQLQTGGPVGAPVQTSTATPGTLSLAPNAFQFAAPTAGGAQQQAGAVTPTGSQAQSAISGQGPVSATSVAGPGVSRTQTTQGTQVTGFQTTGQQTAANLPAQPSTALSSATSSGAGAAGASTAGAQAASTGTVAQRLQDGATAGSAASQSCTATAAELRMAE